MRFDYPRLVATVDSLLATFGFAVTLVRRKDGPYDPATGRAPITETQLVYRAVLLKFERGTNETNSGTTDSRFYLSPLGHSATPEPHDHFVLDGTRYSIVTSTPVRTGGSTIVHDCVARQG